MNIIELFKYIFLGLIQGFTEPIPVSSSGHLLIFQRLMTDLKEIDFEMLATLTNFGSLIAIIILFRKDIVNLFKGFFGFLSTKRTEYKNDYKYALMIILATIPAGIL